MFTVFNSQNAKFATKVQTKLVLRLMQESELPNIHKFLQILQFHRAFYVVVVGVTVRMIFKTIGGVTVFGCHERFVCPRIWQTYRTFFGRNFGNGKTV